jgi:hypothetical protein
MLILKFGGVAHIVRQTDLKHTLCGLERPEESEIFQPYQLEATCPKCQDVAMLEIRETKPVRPVGWTDKLSEHLPKQ